MSDNSVRRYGLFRKVSMRNSARRGRCTILRHAPKIPDGLHPAILLEIDSSFLENHPLLLQQLFLTCILSGRAWKRDSSLRIDYSMPWYPSAVRAGVECVTRQASLAGESAQSSDLTVGCDFASGDLADGVPDETIHRCLNHDCHDY